MLRMLKILPAEVKKQWIQSVDQVPVIGFNSGKCDINMVKKHFVNKIGYDKEDECNGDVCLLQRMKINMFMTTSKFKFLEVKNYIGPGLSYDAWYKSTGYILQKLMFLYEWLDSYEKLNHVVPLGFEDFYRSLKPTITNDEYEQFFKMFKVHDCTTVGDWLRVYNIADVLPIIEAFAKRAEQYYPNKIDVCKDDVSIPGISTTCMLNKSSIFILKALFVLKMFKLLSQIFGHVGKTAWLEK